jgi:dihydroflavonol-4-reductase
MKIISGYTGRKFLPLRIPKWFLRAAAVLGEGFARVLRRKPLFTPYSMATLQTNAFFCNRKARRELGYRTRPLQRTVQNVLRSLGYRKHAKSTI